MNKSELIESVAAQADISKAAAGRFLDALLGTITSELVDGKTVNLIGFGTFMSKAQPARKGRNPQTGATIEIAARNQVGFKVGKPLKDAVNS